METQSNFEYVQNRVVRALTPQSGPVVAGTLVRVAGASFAPGFLVCSFGGDETEATYVSATWLQCRAPARSWPGLVSLEVSVNSGGDFTRSGVSYEYERGLSPARLVPSSGPSRGRTRVSVLGESFYRRELLRCRFGHVEVPAVFVSSSALNCTSVLSKCK